MKKFLTVIFTIFGLMVGMLALMAIEYQISYNKWINSRSGSQVTNPVQKYSSSSDGNKDDFESSKQEYASSSDRKNKDNLESLMNMFMKRLFPPTLLDPDYTYAYEEAKSWSKKHLSQQQIKIYLTKYDRYSEDATQYALNKLNVDWKEQALLKAKSYQEFHYSKEKLVEQLINIEKFTQEEADYAIEQGNFDWKEEAVKKAEFYANGGKITKEKLLEKLVVYRKFTQEEAEYAIEHAKIDWSN
ncbi:Host cell surface-exposed lipoprotein [Streptococcus parasanguinis]|uniref:Ltp family lipoprotein n=1 Tax=Streptococcus parasanguinis TaxID=1318 RepID=UPI000F77BDC9|nr:Ltp family lipoprotein [Streptococcus parasanguinis]MCP8989303.1 Ltp family lipoprotein [Streptococcus parasanguinis]MCP8991287.1 Ltp family lipoprotein [Streptococcus parasanguinis]MCP9002296.1 Ltp family lipoprotein [Streptococcus parasanguinis]MCP9008389.1 Ltp family lipoprotein [Streptococcus parasanguinis]MCP9033120.1 Ltp family lipoprotein [Streptococcus parasanguinis]